MKSNDIRINETIKAKMVKLVGTDTPTEDIPFQEALKKAYDMDLDLIQVSVAGNMPVCRIGSADKFIYEQKLKEKQRKKNAKKIQTKEVRFSPTIAEHDLEIKLATARRILKEGDTLLLKMQMRGREVQMAKEHASKVADIANRLSDCGKVQGKPKINGRCITITVKP